MSDIPQNYFDEKTLIDCVQRIFSKHHVGGLLAKYKGVKEEGVSFLELYMNYLFCDKNDETVE